MSLSELLTKMINSDRIIVDNAHGDELYRGYVANFVQSEADKTRAVKRVQLATDIFLKKNRGIAAKEKNITEPMVPVENISDFRFSDLEMLIYTRIILEE